MDDPPLMDVAISPVPTSRQARALWLVFSGEYADNRAGQVAAALAANQAGRQTFDGLFEARRGNRLVGAVWSCVQPGATAVVWPAQLSPNEPESTAELLYQAAHEYLLAQQVSLAQTLLKTDGGIDCQRLTRAGFTRASDVLYLVSLQKEFPEAAWRSSLEFVPYRESFAARLADIVERTYIGTLDCPTLSGVRNVVDVLAGYRATGSFNPDRWLIVRHQNSDVGCVLLTEHHDHLQWELTYMGLVPEARGHGLGIEITRHAQWLAGEQGCRRMILAVDAANDPAMRMYAAAGFIAWDRRSVLLRAYR